MNFSMKTGLASAMIALASVGLLVSGPAVAVQSSMHHTTKSDSSMSSAMNRYGGPSYTGKPALSVTVALIQAGGGPKHFSFVTALNNLLGKKTVNAEVSKLKNQYGGKRVQNWVQAMNFYVDDALQIIRKKGIKLPTPADQSGTQLAVTLVKAGTVSNGTFWAGNLFDHALSHPIHVQLMNDADAQYSAQWDANAHAITNQAFYDVAQALGLKNVKLASFHK